MKKQNQPASRVSEPLQIYLAPDERRMLDALAAETGLSRAEILRRGMRSFAAERAGEKGPMELFMDSMRDAVWPTDIAVEHDQQLTRAYTDTHSR